MKRITDPSFKYRPSYETDLSKTFARLRREQKEREDAEKKITEEQERKLVRIKR